MAVTLDDFVKKKETVKAEVINTEVYGVKPVNADVQQVKAERLIALTEKGKRLLKRMFIEGKINLSKKPWWWDEV